jgi:hypothetical protein
MIAYPRLLIRSGPNEHRNSGIAIGCGGGLVDDLCVTSGRNGVFG